MILVTGGARCGKSRHAESLISQSPRVCYIATSPIFDAEMAQRIQHHRDNRPAYWHTEERWQNLAEIITTLITNILFASGNEEEIERWDFSVLEKQVDIEIDALITACKQCPSPIVLVTNEVGMGIVPENRLARHFRDIAGRVNQKLAQAADDVWLVVSGIGVKIK